MKSVKLPGRIKRRIGANGPGITVAVIAILVALTGVAFAAGGALTGPQKKEVKTLIKKEAAKLRGPAGAAGSQGAPGEKGNAGSAGVPGKAGNDGASVKVTEIQEGEEECAELGGALVEKEGSSSPVEVCNGAKGAKGENGEPWTLGGKLPAGATEVGVWSFSATGEQTFTTEVEGAKETITVGLAEQFVPISFPLPLVGNLSASGCSTVPKPATCKVHFQSEAEFGDACTSGNVTGLPKAAVGQLCVYEGSPINVSLENATFKAIDRVGAKGGGAAGASQAGALLVFDLKAGEKARGNGTFAVTAPNPLVTAVSPNHGSLAGGTSVTITGSNLQTGTVNFGTVEGVECEPVNTAGTEVTCTSPPSTAGPVDVTVAVSGYTSPINPAGRYTYE